MKRRLSRDHPPVLLPVLSPSSTRITRERAVKCHSGPAATPRDPPSSDEDNKDENIVKTPELAAHRTVSADELETFGGAVFGAGSQSAGRGQGQLGPGVHHLAR